MCRQPGGSQNSPLGAFAGKAFTIVLAGFAFSVTTLLRFPALVGFFWRVWTMATPGMTNLPFSVASQLSASAAARALLVMIASSAVSSCPAAAGCRLVLVVVVLLLLLPMAS